MDLRGGIGNWGVAVASCLAFAMCLINFLLSPVEIQPLQYGLCLDSPDSWNLGRFLSWFLNTILLGIIAFGIYLVNKTYNFARTTEPVMITVFLIMASSSPWFSQSLNTSTLLCGVNLLSLTIIFGAYEKKNATQQMFILGVLSGFGGMLQYAFLPMGCIYIIWALFMKILRLKEILAFIIGMVSPYWIGLGLGLIHFHQFHFPSLVPLFGASQDYSDILFLLGGIGVASLFGILAGFPNAMKLYAGNSRVNAMNSCITIMGLGSLICILVDYENVPAYVLSLYMCVAVQMANICALWNINYRWTVTVVPALVYILLFVGNLVL